MSVELRKMYTKINKFKRNISLSLPVFPSVEVLPVVSGHALGCFCHSYGRFLGIILLPTAYRTLLKTQECSSCSTGIIVSPAAAGFPFPARAGGSRRSHIPSSPHQRHGPAPPPRWRDGSGGFLPPTLPKTSFNSVPGDTAPCPASFWGAALGAGLCWGRRLGTSRRCGRRGSVQLRGCRTDVLLCAVIPRLPHPAPDPLPAPSLLSAAKPFFTGWLSGRAFVLMQGQCSPWIYCLSQSALLE